MPAQEEGCEDQALVDKTKNFASQRLRKNMFVDGKHPITPYRF
jgi:hypothetical protein